MVLPSETVSPQATRWTKVMNGVHLAHKSVVRVGEAGRDKKRTEETHAFALRGGGGGASGSSFTGLDRLAPSPSRRDRM